LPILNFFGLLFRLLDFCFLTCICMFAGYFSILKSGTIFIFLISKRSALFDLLESFLTTKSSEGLRASQLACRVSIIPNFYVHSSPVSAFYVLFWLIEFVVFIGLVCVIFSEQRWLFRKATLASSTKPEALGLLS